MSFLATSSEGVRRLSLFGGGIGALLWLVYLLQNANLSALRPVEWLIVICGFVFFPFVGFALVRLVAWVIFGFMRK